MCGIAGIIDYRQTTDSRLTTGRMLNSISYRGPDESGIYHSPFASIGNVRLSILDIQGGHQPLSDPSGRYWITFNGQIFNYKELRSDLESRGHKFRTHSDTQVLVQLFAEYGHKCLSMLNGQFAFAVWDKLKEELFIARDRVGIRPFFYNLHDGVFSFASEIKALFQQKEIPREISHEGLSQVFTFWTTITPSTIFRDIYELSPGHYGYFTRNGLTTHRYWSLDFSGAEQPLSLDEATSRFDELFTDSVRIRLRADVEIGAYLSGGIDSSATVAYIKKLEPGVLNTFSIGFSEKDFDETSYQNEAVSFFGTRHKSYSCTSDDIARSIPDVVWHSEIPVTRTAPAPMLLLSKIVRENNIKVVVTGEGSDELLGGYDIFKETVIRRFWASQPQSELRPRLFKRLYQYIPQISSANNATFRMFFGYMLEDTGNPFYSHLLRWNNSNHIKKHFSDNLKEELRDFSAYDRLPDRLPADFSSWDPLAKSQWLETTIFMSGYLLSSQGDRMAMANSVEGRYPFLDYRIIEFCNSLNPDFKLHGLKEKYLLKKLLSGKIPENIINRVKQPYRAPIRNVFLSGKAPDYVKEMLSEDYFRKAGLFNYKSVDSLVNRVIKSGTSTEIDDMTICGIITTHLLHFLFTGNNQPEGKESANLKITEDMSAVPAT